MFVFSALLPFDGNFEWDKVRPLPFVQFRPPFLYIVYFIYLDTIYCVSNVLQLPELSCNLTHIRLLCEIIYQFVLLSLVNRFCRWNTFLHKLIRVSF